MVERAARPLLVAEMFGPTVQGEGPSTGQQAVFVRLSRCNLSCPPCDTPFTWDTSRYDLRTETQRLPGEQVVAWVLAQTAPLVVITGGEPLLQQEVLVPVVASLTAAGRRVEIETNGTIAPTANLQRLVSAFNVSPKLATFAAATDDHRRINPTALGALMAGGKAVFKFVVHGTDDLAEVDQLCTAYGLGPVWVMPEGTTAQQVVAVSQAVANDVVRRGWNLSSRLHVLCWGDQRGR
ncbi:7-carboxy-7-deazaguanine synthase QueE [Solwaraspora sp. WMMD1047]|uniref:7-carboxy-7-deazaguanine synthase QueE n=1 Tax=Solwaraspora sp. WMMD1047 TaxID=3016102 RepID=UPI002415F03B|nr:7-carboxy-7-deazaguanine synthase QueE [Solwaraspora sp. WMMD1047]MDG4830006.1 7-carboxy-7-deazaguanine synthase QueE [Solwaraspora sp. WMMD1047]